MSGFEKPIEMKMDDDYNRFCRVCSWNDSDYGCTSPSGEEVWQCPMYIHYHPEEVKKFNEDMDKREQERLSMTVKEIKAKLDKSNLDSDTIIELTRYIDGYQVIADFIEENRPTEVNTDWERGCAYALDEIEKLCITE